MEKRDRPGVGEPLRIEPRLPTHAGAGDHSPEFAGLFGATIVRIGSLVDSKQRVDGNRLGIEYRWPGDDETRTLVLGFSEIGLWVVR